MSSRPFHHAAIPAGNSVLAGPNPTEGVGFVSPYIQLLSNDTPISWSDPAPHLHLASDEMFVVLEGTVVFMVDDQEVAVAAGEFCGFPATVVHSVVRAEPPVRCFVIRSPAIQDKEYLPGG